MRGGGLEDRLARKVRQQATELGELAEQLQQQCLYSKLVEARLTELAPGHPLPVRAEHLGGKLAPEPSHSHCSAAGPGASKLNAAVFRRELASLQSEAGSLRRSYDTAQAKLREACNQVRNAKGELAAKEKENCSLLEELGRLRVSGRRALSHAQAQAQAQSHGSGSEGKGKDMEALLDYVQELLEKNSMFEEAKRKLSSLQGTLQLTTTGLEKTQQELSLISAEAERYKRQSQDQAKQLEHLEASLSASTGQMKDMGKLHSDLLEEAQGTTAAKEAAEDEVERLKVELASVSAERLSLEESLETVVQKLELSTQAAAEVETLKAALSRKSEAHEAAKARLEELREEKSRLLTAVSNLDDQVAAMKPSHMLVGRVKAAVQWQEGDDLDLAVHIAQVVSKVEYLREENAKLSQCVDQVQFKLQEMESGRGVTALKEELTRATSLAEEEANLLEQLEEKLVEVEQQRDQAEAEASGALAEMRAARLGLISIVSAVFQGRTLRSRAVQEQCGLVLFRQRERENSSGGATDAEAGTSTTSELLDLGSVVDAVGAALRQLERQVWLQAPRQGQEQEQEQGRSCSCSCSKQDQDLAAAAATASGGAVELREHQHNGAAISLEEELARMERVRRGILRSGRGVAVPRVSRRVATVGGDGHLDRHLVAAAERHASGLLNAADVHLKERLRGAQARLHALRAL